MHIPFAILAALAFTVSTTSASRATIHRLKQQHTSLHRRSPQSDQVNIAPVNDGGNAFDINSVHDLIYMADITVGSTNYTVQLDTGSSDLFIKGETYPIPSTQETNLMLNLSYAVGWAHGHIAFAPVDFVGIHIPRQAFLDAETAGNPALGLGAHGIVGLGFTRLSSIDNELNSTGASTGRALLQNLFEANPQEPNFIAFALHRSNQPDDDVEGSFSIGELEPEYSGILGNAPIPTWPRHDPVRWNVLLDALIVNDTIIPGTTGIAGAPSNKAVVLLDSGASYTYSPPEVCEAIYGTVPGARFDPAISLWRVPCDAEINLALQIGGQVFPVHPLDLVMQRSPTNTTNCIGTFIPQFLGDDWDFDWLIGDNFLRSVYSVYDFGDFDSEGKMGNPYVKLLSLVEPDEASVEFHNLRGGTPRTGIRFTGLDGVSVAPSFAISTDISESLEMIGKFMPAMLAVVAFNALLLVVGSIVWLVAVIRRRKRKAVPRIPRARTAASTRPNSYIAGSPEPRPPNHTYEPVSMALTDDTFAPPSAAFRGGFGYGSPMPGDRPKSVA
ncbi:acid protease [Coprinopsis marcescibilis]|uniref:Acid protease n=1 Tax=Coprinopsis marcescibilis TaxID=230819 RepID=A0A5C3L7T3_COPMA|nr:acid protease [Coprinopsis marcescibilis]